MSTKYIAIQKPGEDVHTWYERRDTGPFNLACPAGVVECVFHATGQTITRDSDGELAEVYELVGIMDITSIERAEC